MLPPEVVTGVLRGGAAGSRPALAARLRTAARPPAEALAGVSSSPSGLFFMSESHAARPPESGERSRSISSSPVSELGLLSLYLFFLFRPLFTSMGVCAFLFCTLAHYPIRHCLFVLLELSCFHPWAIETLYLLVVGSLEKRLLTPQPSSSGWFKGPNVCIKALLSPPPTPALSPSSLLVRKTRNSQARDFKDPRENHSGRGQGAAFYHGE